MIRIVTDSSADIPRHVAEALDITVIPLTVTFGSESFREGVDISSDVFYDRLMREHPQLPKTAIPSPYDFEETYRSILDDGDDIISIHLSSSLSALHNLAVTTARELDPSGERIVVIDSRSVSMCLGWTAISAAELALRDEEMADIVAHVQDMIPRLRIPSFLDTLEFIKAGGRIGSAQAMLGTVLDMKPILHLEDGSVAPLERVRTRTKAIDRLVEMAREIAPFDDLAVMHTHAPQMAEELARKLSAVHPRGNILIAETGVVMGTHTGPNSLGICAVVSHT